MLYDEEELMFEGVKDKGYVQLKTNFGDINLELFCDRVRPIPSLRCDSHAGIRVRTGSKGVLQLPLFG
jgi:hypothetical protein